MIGGFLACGTPDKMIDILIELNVKDLTIIANDTSFVDRGIGRLIVNGQVKRVIASHIGTNAETGRLMTEGKMEVELVPQGTLIERIRAGGAGLGGVFNTNRSWYYGGRRKTKTYSRRQRIFIRTSN